MTATCAICPLPHPTGPARAEPNVAEIGHSCQPCADRMLRSLSDIETTMAQVELAHEMFGAQPVKRALRDRVSGATFGSQPPADLDVIAAMDPRTQRLYDENGRPEHEDDALSPYRKLKAWEDVARRARGITTPSKATRTSEIAHLLRLHHAWILSSEELIDYAETLAEVRGYVLARLPHAKPTREKPICPCTHCDTGQVWAGTGTVPVCDHCGTQFDTEAITEARLSNARQIESRTAPDVVATLAERGVTVTESQVKHWGDRGHIWRAVYNGERRYLPDEVQHHTERLCRLDQQHLTRWGQATRIPPL